MPSRFPAIFMELPLRRLDEDEETKSPPAARAAIARLSSTRCSNRARCSIFGEVDMKMAERVTAQLLAYAAEGEGDIRVILNSPGGHVESGDTIHDMIRFVGPRVKMIGTGWVASAGAHIFLGARKENRFCLAEHALPAAPAPRRHPAARRRTFRSRRKRS